MIHDIGLDINKMCTCQNLYGNLFSSFDFMIHTKVCCKANYTKKSVHCVRKCPRFTEFHSVIFVQNCVWAIKSLWYQDLSSGEGERESTVA